MADSVSGNARDALMIKSARGIYPVRVGYSDAQAAVHDALAAATHVVADRAVVQKTAGLATALEARPHKLVDVGESLKTLAGVESLCAWLGDVGASRKSTLAVVGGGTLQDACSFAASVYHRGIDWVFVPTTLLAQCDSCIGAKSSINIAGFKNILGGFHAPRAVFVSAAFVSTLTESDVRSGFGEALKLALIAGPASFSKLAARLDARGAAPGEDVEALVLDSLATKQRYIETDEFDVGVRRILNYGHTFGHALESLSDFGVPHGVAVSWGLDLINHVGVRRGWLDEETAARVHAVVRRHFPVVVPDGVGGARLVDVVRRDKKAGAGAVGLVILRDGWRMDVHPTALDDLLVADVDAFLSLHA